MVSDVLDIRAELDKSTSWALGRRGWICISLGIAVVGVGVLALLLPEPPVTARTYSLEPTATTLPASLYFDAEQTSLDAADRESIEAIASAARNSPTPVVVAAYAGPSGNRDRNLRVAQKRAAGVRDALVTAGVPTLRIVLVSPSFAATNDGRRIEISAVRGVRAFPTATAR
jgi:outer membrane protein OmpA-like peptidoglycan-associated protein